MDISITNENVPEKKDSTLYKEVEHLLKMKLMRIERQMKMLKFERWSLQVNGGKIAHEVQKQKPYIRRKELDFYRTVDKIYAYQYLKIQGELTKLDSLKLKYQIMLGELPYVDYEDLAKDLDVSTDCVEFTNLTPRITLSFSFNAEELNKLVQSFREAEPPDSYRRRFLDETNNHIYLFKSLFEPGSNKASTGCCSAKSSSVCCSLPIYFPCLDTMTHDVPQDIQFHKSEKDCSQSSHSSDSFEFIDKDCQNNLQCNNDIENLSEISSVSSSNFISEWLRKNDSLDNFKQIALEKLPHIIDICKNERKCSNYSSCACPTNCLVAHLKEQLEKLRFSDKFSNHSVKQVVNEIIQEKMDKTLECPSQKCSRAENLWKIPSGKWDPNTSWLSSKSHSSIDTKEWLIPTATNVSPNSTSSVLKSSFSSYFLEQNNKEWLSH